MYSEYKRKPFNAAMGQEADERNLEMEQRGNAANDARELGEHDGQDEEARMAEQVCALLTQRADLDARDIQVNVHAGEVWLEGTVNNEPSKRLAADLLKTLFGMTAVHNNLQVRQTETHLVVNAETGQLARGPLTPDEPQIKPGMLVVGSDGAHVGHVKQAFNNSIHVERRLQHDLYIPYSAFAGIENDRVVLSIRSDQVDNWGWDKPILI